VAVSYNPQVRTNQEFSMSRKQSSAAAPVIVLLLAACLTHTLLAQTTPAPASPETQDARTWIGRNAEMEAYLKTAEMLSFKDLSVGVTKPQRATLPAGGPMQYLVWKTIQPGRYGGYWESYKSEIAAYELDKLLQLNMVPPTVERVHKGVRGAAVMWAAPTKSFHDLGGAPTAPVAQQGMWARQIVKAKMFHNLTGNIDPNLGNWLVDPLWNLVLIDFTRCFTTEQTVKHEITRVDEDLWKRMETLTEATLAPVIGNWVGKGERQALLNRRDRMKKLIDQLVKQRGETYVFMRDVVK
jgi:hypothetical protein